MLREIDMVLEHNADKAVVREAHAFCTTALDGLLRGAREAEDRGSREDAEMLRAEARRLDAVFALRIQTKAARSA